MTEEFDKLKEFFALDPKDKAEQLDNVFEQSVSMFQRLADVLKTGTDEEKKALMEEMGEMQSLLEDETKRACEAMGVSEEELAKLSSDPKNFSEDIWKKMQDTKEEIKEETDQIVDIAKEAGYVDPEDKDKKKKRPPDRQNWIQS